MNSVFPVLGEQYRLNSHANPFYGIGTVASVSKEDRTGTLVSEESGLIHFNDFNLSAIHIEHDQLVKDCIEAILLEIAQLEKTRVLPVGGVKSFSELHDYIDANVLILKHVPREENWVESEKQSQLDNLIMDLVSKEMAQ